MGKESPDTLELIELDPDETIDFVQTTADATGLRSISLKTSKLNFMISRGSVCEGEENGQEETVGEANFRDEGRALFGFSGEVGNYVNSLTAHSKARIDKPKLATAAFEKARNDQKMGHGEKQSGTHLEDL